MRPRVRRMRVLMLTWEFPPRSVGGIAAHVDGLSQALAQSGHDVVLLTLSHPGAPADSRVGGVRVLRARADLPWLPDDELVARVASANHHLVQLSTRLGNWVPHVVHAHDWQVAWAADTLATLHRAKLIATFHSTERGQHGGRVPPGQPSTIHAIESWLAHDADRGRHQLQVHGQRGDQRLRAPGRAHPPDPQRHRPDVVVDGRVAGRADPARVHVGPGPVREGLPGARPGDAAAAFARAGDRVRHRWPRQLPPGAAVADRPRGRQRPRAPPRLPARRPAAGHGPPGRVRGHPVAVRAVRHRRPGGARRRRAARRRPHRRARRADRRHRRRTAVRARQRRRAGDVHRDGAHRPRPSPTTCAARARRCSPTATRGRPSPAPRPASTPATRRRRSTTASLAAVRAEAVIEDPPDRGRHPAPATEHRVGEVGTIRPHAPGSTLRGHPRHPPGPGRTPRAGQQPALELGRRGHPPVRPPLAGLAARHRPSGRDGPHDDGRAPGRAGRRPRHRQRHRRRVPPPADGAQGHDVVRLARRLPAALGRLLLARVRHQRGPPAVLRRPRRARRRPPQGVVRPRRAARRHRPAVHRGLLPPAPRRRGLAAGERRRLHAALARARRHGRRADRRPRRRRRQGPRLAGRCRAHPALPPRHRRRRQLARRRRRHRPPLRRRRAPPPAPGDRARHRRRAGAARPRPGARRVPHQRGPRRLPRAGAGPRARRPAAWRSTPPSRSSAVVACSRPTRPCRPASTASRASCSSRTSPTSPPSAACRSTSCSPSACARTSARRRRGAEVQHGGDGSAPGGPLQRRRPPPRRREPPDVPGPVARRHASARCRSARSPTASTGARGRRPASTPCSPASSARTGTAPTPQRWGRVRDIDPRRGVGHAERRPRRARAPRPPAPRRGRARPDRAHRRLRPPLRHVQAGDAAAADADRLCDLLHDSRPAGAVRVRRQGPPRRHARARS